MRFAQLAAILVAGVSFAAAADQSPAMANGAAVYARPGQCAMCHQATGLGLPGAFPPLAGSEWVKGDPVILAKIVLHGMNGPVTVAGKKFASAMPGQAAALKDNEIADVLTYIRGSWGNAAEPVSTEVVAKVRAEFPTHAPWTAKQLMPAQPAQ